MTDSGSPADPAVIRHHILSELAIIEAQYPGGDYYTDADHFGCVHYPLELFADLVDAAVADCRQRAGRPDAPMWLWDPFFLDVGCGYGTKCLYVSRMHHLHAAGIDRVEEYVRVAREYKVAAYLRSADEYKSYGIFGIVYVNHPYRDAVKQRELDFFIKKEMQPGAVLISVNQALDSVPPASWEPILKPENWPVHGVWRKP